MKKIASARSARNRHNRDEIENLKAKLVDPLAVCMALELADGHRAQSGGIVIRCPWHDDTNPSCSVTVGEQNTLRGHCFSCGATKDVIDLVAIAKQLDVTTQFADVLREAHAVVALLETTPNVAPEEDRSLDFALFDRAARILLEAAPISAARDVASYLERRGLLQAALRHMWGALPAEAVKQSQLTSKIAREIGDEAWMRTGLAVGPTSFKHPTHVIVIPWRDEQGRIVTLQRRRLDDDDPRYVMPAGRPALTPYGVEHLVTAADSGEVAFVEGAFDVLAAETLYESHGLNRVVLGIPGVGSWNPAWAKFCPGRTCHIAVDRDDAGEKVAAKMADDLHAAGAARVFRQRPVGAKDWSELLLEARS